MRNLAKQIEKKYLKQEKDLACTSFEIRSPLNALLSIIELIPKVEPAKQGELLLSANNCGDILQNLFNKICNTHKIKNNMMKVDISDSDISEVINQVIMTHKIRANNKGLYFNIIRDKNIPPCVKIDTTKIAEVLTKLISNSIRFTDKGLVVTKLTWFPITKDNYSTKDFEKGMEEALNNSSRDEIINSVDEDLGSRMLSQINMKVHKKLKEYKGMPHRLEESDWLYEREEMDTSPGPWLKYGKGIFEEQKFTDKVRFRYIYIYIYSRPTRVCIRKCKEY